jgi:hypothetical protein
MPRNSALKTAAGIAASFIALAGTVIFLSAMKIITFAMAKLMLLRCWGCTSDSDSHCSLSRFASWNERLAGAALGVARSAPVSFVR